MKSKNTKIIWQAHEANVSGANIAMLEYMDALAIEFRFLVILPNQGNMQKELQQRCIPYSIIHQYGWTNIHPWWGISKWIKVFVRSNAALWQTRQLLKKEKPSLVCTNTLIPFVASIAAWLQKIPHVWWIHEYGKEDFGFTTGWGHEKFSMRWMQRSSKLIIANSKATSAKFIKLMPTATIKTIYQPVSFNGIKAAAKHARFLMFGQLVPSKGHKDVLNAMIDNKKEGKPLNTLHIKGPSEIKSYYAELQEFVIQHGLEDFVKIEAGYFKKEEVIPNYDVLIVASQAEAFGRVIVEANKAGIPVLVRNIGGAPELINESNGILFDNQSELAAALCDESIFPVKDIRINYNEATEIQLLMELLYKACK